MAIKTRESGFIGSKFVGVPAGGNVDEPDPFRPKTAATGWSGSKFVGVPGAPTAPPPGGSIADQPARGGAVGIWGPDGPRFASAAGVGDTSWKTQPASGSAVGAWDQPASGSAAGVGDQSWRDQPAFGSAAGVGDMSWKTHPASGIAAGVGSGASLTGGAGVAPQDMQRLMMQANARAQGLTAGGALPQDASALDHALYNRPQAFAPDLLQAASQPGFNPRRQKMSFKDFMMLHELQNQQNEQR